jgi:hypothetical protein
MGSVRDDGGSAGPGRRRRVVFAFAAVLSVVALGGGVAVALVAAQPILAIFGVILAVAPWGAVIDQLDRGGPR